MIHPEQERVRKLLTEAVTLLCRNSLQFEEEVVVEGLIGITLDRSDILLISIRESVQQTLREVTSSIRSDKESVTPTSPGKRKRRKRSQDSDSDAPPSATPPTKKPAPSVTDDDDDDSRPDPEQRLNVKKETPEDDKDNDDRNTSQARSKPDGRTIHPAHDSSSSNSQTPQISDHSSTQIKQEPSGSNQSTDSTTQPAPHEQTLPPGGVRVKEEEEEEPDECYVIDSEDEDMSNSSASNNSMSLNMLESQLQMASQNWPSMDDSGGLDLNSLMQQGQVSSRALFQFKDHLSRYGDSYDKDKMVLSSGWLVLSQPCSLLVGIMLSFVSACFIYMVYQYV